MTIEEFVTKYNGKFVEVWDKSSPNQCVDLVLKWIQEQGHGDLIPLGIQKASDLWTKTPAKVLTHYNKVKNTLEAIPRAGSIVVWSDKYGPAGHVAIATGKAGQTQFEAFSQNDPVGVPSVIKRYNYTNVLGWLELKSLEHENMSDLQQKLDTYFNQVVNSDFVINYINNLKDENSKKDKAITEKDKEIAKLKELVALTENKLTNELAKAQLECQGRVDDTVDKYQLQLDDKDKRIADLEKQIEEEGNVIIEHEKPRQGWHKKLVDLLDALVGYERT